MSTSNDTREALAAKCKDLADTLYTGPVAHKAACVRLVHAAIDELAALTEQPAAPQLPEEIRRIRIPTDTMEQEFQVHYRRGYEAGKRAAAPQVQAEPLTDEQRLHLGQAADLLDEYGNECSRGGADSTAKGCEASAYVLRQLLRAAPAAPAQEPQQPATREARLRAAMDRMDRDGPLPGMISAFEAEFGGDWTDPSWRQETAIWASAWRRAASSPAPAVQPTEAVAELVGALRRARDVIKYCDIPVDTSIDRALAKHGKPQGGSNG